MEAGPEPEAGIRQLVARMDGRISTMALVHKKLYESKDLSRVDLGEYLEELDELHRRLGVESRLYSEVGRQAASEFILERKEDDRLVVDAIIARQTRARYRLSP